MSLSQKLGFPEFSSSPSTGRRSQSLIPADGKERQESPEYAPKSAGVEECSTSPSPTLPPPPSPRGFHIPLTRFTKALEAEAESFPSYWQYHMYEGPGGPKDKVKLHYCKNKEAMEPVAKLFLQEKVIGFDIEWMAQARSTDGIKRNVSLIQLASEDRIALFHIARFPGKEEIENLVAPSFKHLMESAEYTKVGVAIKGDCTRLRNFLKIDCRGLFELSYLHNLVSFCSGEIEKLNRKVVKLSTQVQMHLGLPILKGNVQTSDWSRDLEYQQTQCE